MSKFQFESEEFDLIHAEIRTVRCGLQISAEFVEISRQLKP
jgi:hypothetical protein